MKYIIILILLIFIWIVKYLTNKDLIKEHCKTENDKANAKNARKVYSRTKTSIIILIAAFVSLIVVLLLKFTNIDYIVRDYISTDFVEKREYSDVILIIPFYILVSRQIVIEVLLGDFLYKFFKVEEPEVESTAIKNILYKKTVKEAPKKLNLEEIANREIVAPPTNPDILDLPIEKK